MYIDNWNAQANMLCENKNRIGFLGACFFIGILVASVVVPIGFLSDLFGRKQIFVITLIVLLISEAGFIFANSLDQLYVFMFLYGFSFPGRIIVGQNFAYEFCTDSIKNYFQPIMNVVGGLIMIFTSFYFQVLSKRVIWLEIPNFIFTVYLLG